LVYWYCGDSVGFIAGEETTLGLLVVWGQRWVYCPGRNNAWFIGIVGTALVYWHGGDSVGLYLSNSKRECSINGVCGDVTL